MTKTIDILGKRLKLAHLPNGFITSMDSVLLAAACPAQSNDKVLDMGCGVGGAGFCLMARQPNIHLTGVDIQEEQIKLAELNADANGYKDTTNFETINVKDLSHEKTYHHIITNPPYLKKDEHLRSAHDEKAKAMGFDDDGGTLGEWIGKAHFCLKSKGTLTLIHRADCMDDIIRIIGKRFGAIEVIPLWPKTGVNAKRVIIRAIKDRRSPATLHYGLTLHDQDGQYTMAADKILKHAEGLLL